MSCWAIIPIKAGTQAKSRLADALAPSERRQLVRSMLAHVYAEARAAQAISRVCLVGASRAGLPDDVELLSDPGEGLNPAVQSAFEHAAGEGADRILIVAADLPGVTAQELDLLAVARPGAIAIAPDRHETGTNAISLPLPAASRFRFAFGTDSYARHQSEARRIGVEVETILGQGLERDIDEPEDLPDVTASLGRPG